jgi:hypothetical protein
MPTLIPQNIMVSDDDPTIVTAVLDWECANTAPAWAVAQLPEFLLDGDFEEQAAERDSKARLRDIFTSSIQDAVGIKVGQEKCLVALEEVAQTIPTMRKIEDMERRVLKVLADLTSAGFWSVYP